MKKSTLTRSLALAASTASKNGITVSVPSKGNANMTVEKGVAQNSVGTGEIVPIDIQKPRSEFQVPSSDFRLQPAGALRIWMRPLIWQSRCTGLNLELEILVAPATFLKTLSRFARPALRLSFKVLLPLNSHLSTLS